MLIIVDKLRVDNPKIPDATILVWPQLFPGRFKAKEKQTATNLCPGDMFRFLMIKKIAQNSFKSLATQLCFKGGHTKMAAKTLIFFCLFNSPRRRFLFLFNLPFSSSLFYHSNRLKSLWLIHNQTFFVLSNISGKTSSNGTDNMNRGESSIVCKYPLFK